MSADVRKSSHTVSRLTCHVVWVTKYRFKVLKGDIQKRCRELLIQICEAEGIEILKGVVSDYSNVIEGVTISNLTEKTYAISDETGYFSIYLPHFIYYVKKLN